MDAAARKLGAASQDFQNAEPKPPQESESCAIAG
jgi:hypothetical protein